MPMTFDSRLTRMDLRDIGCNYPLVIVGNGGFASEIKAMAHIDRWLKRTARHQKLYTHVDYDYSDGVEDYISIDQLSLNMDNLGYRLVFAIGDPKLRKKMWRKVDERLRGRLYPHNIIHHSAFVGTNVVHQDFIIVCQNTVFTTNIEIGYNCIFNLGVTVGHDCKIGNYVTVSPGANISGNVRIGNFCYLGTNCCVIEGVSICDNVTIGAGAVVTRDITEPGTYVGVPARKVEKNAYAN